MLVRTTARPSLAWLHCPWAMRSLPLLMLLLMLLMLLSPMPFGVSTVHHAYYILPVKLEAHHHHGGPLQLGRCNVSNAFRRFPGSPRPMATMPTGMCPCSLQCLSAFPRFTTKTSPPCPEPAQGSPLPFGVSPVHHEKTEQAAPIVTNQSPMPFGVSQVHHR